jgi:hypothetical protein
LEFTHYYGRHKRQNNTVLHINVIQGKIFPVRIGGELRNRIEKRVRETDKDFSKLTRLLWEDYFKKLDDVAWQKELKEDFGG